MVDRSRNRSDSYQYKLVESSCSPDLLNEVVESDSHRFQLYPNTHNERLMDLKEKLRIRFWTIVDTKLTDRQKQVLHMVSDGHTQTDIAKKLNVNQSSVTKSLNGNCDYRNGKRFYGGSKKKLQKLIEKDEQIQKILKDINDIESEEDFF